MMKESRSNSNFDRPGYLVDTIPGVLSVYLLTLIPLIMKADRLTFTFSWVPSLGVEFSLLVDGLSLVFGLIITIIGTLVILYAGSYLVDHPPTKTLLHFDLTFYGCYAGGGLQPKSDHFIRFLGIDQH